MIGRDLSLMNDLGECCIGKPTLEVKSLSYTNETGAMTLDNINLYICSGEILGIAGVDGNGQRELAETIYGLSQVTEGSILLNGEEIREKAIDDIINMGVGYIPEDRHKTGLLLDFTVSENLILKDYNCEDYKKNIFFNVDIGATEFIHKQILKAKEQGAAVLLISTELSEINLLSDRIAVIYKGKIEGEMAKRDFAEIWLQMK